MAMLTDGVLEQVGAISPSNFFIGKSWCPPQCNFMLWIMAGLQT